MNPIGKKPLESGSFQETAGIVGEYHKFLEELEFIYNKTTPLTENDFHTFKNALTGIKNLIDHGMIAGKKNPHFSKSMQKEVSTVFELFNSTGMDLMEGNFNDFQKHMNELKEIDKTDNPQGTGTLSEILKIAGEKHSKSKLQKMIKFWVLNKATKALDTKVDMLTKQLSIYKNLSSAVSDLQTLRTSHLKDPLNNSLEYAFQWIKENVHDVSTEEALKFLENYESIQKTITDLQQLNLPEHKPILLNLDHLTSNFKIEVILKYTYEMNQLKDLSNGPNKPETENLEKAKSDIIEELKYNIRVWIGDKLWNYDYEKYYGNKDYRNDNLLKSISEKLNLLSTSQIDSLKEIKMKYEELSHF